MKWGAVLVLVALLVLPAGSAAACPTIGGIRLSDCDDDERKPRRSGSKREASHPATGASAEAELLRELNHERARRGLRTLLSHGVAADIARAHARAMARAGTSFHNSALGSPETKSRLGRPRWLAENVGHGPSTESIQLAYLNSYEHRRNMLNSVYDHVGVGVVKDGRYYYAVEVFLGGARYSGSWYGGVDAWDGGRRYRVPQHRDRIVRATALLERMLPAIPPRIVPVIAPLQTSASALPWQALALSLGGLLLPSCARAVRARRRSRAR